MKDQEIFSYHLVETDPLTTLRQISLPIGPGEIPGLMHSESMFTMKLGAPILKPSRYALSQLVFFARWENEKALVLFLQSHALGRILDKGWHLRLRFYRRWGMISELHHLPENTVNPNPDSPVVGITLARLKVSESLRFLKWGKPVEKLVRDHPGQSMALASMRPIGTLSTFSIWKSEREMIKMVRGESALLGGSLHADAMVEQAKKSFHHEFTTMRFYPLGEYGQWQGKDHYLPHPPRNSL